MSFSLTNIKTAKDVEAERLKARQDVAKVECRRRILAVCSEASQINMVSSDLSDAQKAQYAEFLAWKGQMRATWRSIAESDQDPRRDENWPEASESILSFVADF